MTESIELPPLNEKDSVAALISSMIEGLRHPSKDDFNDGYCRIRAILRRHPLLRDRLPQFLVESNTVPKYRVWMEEHYEHPYERDAHLQNSLAQLKAHATSGASLEPFEIQHELPRGGFGRLFVAKHRLTDRLFAIKFYQPMFHDGGGTPLSRFFQEASMLFELSHPNIVTIREVGLFRERPFIVMDYFEGTTLNNALMRHGRMPPGKAIGMIELVTSAIMHAHQRKIVHRDLTPSNIMLAPDDCRVIDFGLGIYVEQALRSRLTQQGEAPAGGHYTARELLANPRLIDPCTDIFSIGAIWYHAVTNEVPGGSDLVESLTRTDGLPKSHQDIILTCLADADRRYPSCDELQAAIANAKEEQEP